MTLHFSTKRSGVKAFSDDPIRIVIGLLALVIMLMIPVTAKAVESEHPMRVFKAEAEYDDVKFDLENAIVNAGLKIIYRGNVGQMLERTAGEVGAKRTIYDNAEFFEFCSAPISHSTMGADPRNIVFCPYVLYIYALKGEKNVTYVAYRRPVSVGTEASKAALLNLDKFLEKLVKGVVE